MTRLHCLRICGLTGMPFRRDCTHTISGSRMTGDRLATIEPTVMVNHGGTILTRKEFITEKDGYVQIDEYGFEDSMTLEEWLEENN